MSQVDGETVRRAALYWDKIDHPQSRLVYLGLSTDEEQLKSAGILSETTINDPVQTQEILLEAPGRALLMHHSQEPGQWSLSQSSPDLVLPGGLGAPVRNIEIELYEALPVPAADVPIHDILQFKQQRADELLGFRSAMDALYERIISSRDVPRAQDAALLEIERQLSNVHRVMAETAMRRVISSLKVELSLTDLAIVGTLMSQPLLKLVGAAAACIKVGASIAEGFKNPVKGLKDYAYLGYSAKQLGSRPKTSMMHATSKQPAQNHSPTETKIGRNDPCYCGSGKKYKKCHGK